MSDFPRQIPNGQRRMTPLDMPNPRLALEAVPAINAAMTAEVARAVLRARLNGSSWSEIGRKLGVSKQAACKRWGHLDATPGGVDVVVRHDAQGRVEVAYVSDELREDLDPTPRGRRAALELLVGAAYGEHLVIDGQVVDVAQV